VFTRRSYTRENDHGFFHGVWSFAGFTGALIGLAMLSLDLAPLSSFFNRWSYCDYIDCI
jgi:hypothetical protein